ncbi:hypothetical protein OG223_28405 [Streptomyces sp. NBC_01478]|uniref:hypothetical protein n=1 Tax=Streptomyces sp. NBC_01478 TaxID=2903882 RepID=UPI002E329EB3|nr:hypothetical protein [Streptomyces sp. NBC_01478]
MFFLLLVVALILFGFGFLNPLWWLAAAMLVFQRHPLRPRSRREAGPVATAPVPESTGIAGTVGITRIATTRVTDEVA